MPLVYNPAHGAQESKKRNERAYEIALMEACDIPRVSRHGNLRSAFLQNLHEESPSQASQCSDFEETAHNADEVPVVHSIIPSKPVAAVHQESLDTLEGFHTEHHCPMLSRTREPHISGRPRRFARDLGESILKADTGAEASSRQLRTSVSSPLLLNHGNAYPVATASPLDDLSSTQYQIKEISTPNRNPPRYAHTQGTSQTFDLRTNSPKTFDARTSPTFDGGKHAREYVDYLKRSSHHSEWDYNPDQIDHSPPKPVLRRISSWAAGRFRRGTNHLAQALGLQSQPVLFVDSDRCYIIDCTLPSCQPGRKD